MEPDGINGLNSYSYNKFKKYYASGTKIRKGYLEAFIAASTEARNKSEFVSLYESSNYWQEQNDVKSYALNNYTEEIEDKDLGLVRKINLN